VSAYPAYYDATRPYYYHPYYYGYPGYYGYHGYHGYHGYGRR
jgi:hypothetical protein